MKGLQALFSYLSFRLFKKQSAKTPSGTLFLLECKIHGSHYYECLPLVKDGKLKVGTPIFLKREPQNEYDKNAIEVLTKKGLKLGYVPKKDNAILANLMDQNCLMRAQIDDVKTAAWEPITIRIVMDLL